ncbi:MAG: hypothetical protein AMXMBFR13_27890 [Phycisphaerae bacterium]
MGQVLAVRGMDCRRIHNSQAPMESTLTLHYLRLAMALAIGVSSVGLSLAERPATKPAANAYCPVMPEEKIDPAVTFLYQGKTIGFCCEKCLVKFKANPQRYESRLASFAGSPDQPDEDAAAAGHVHGETTTGPTHEDSQEKDHEHDHLHAHDHGQPQGFFVRLIAWLGKFHPPAVNFPIGLIIAAAVAEALLIATGRPAFAVAGRFCIWFGAIGAAGAALLGWFFGGFHLTDDSWVLTTHRWLGTTTAAWSLLVLFLAERALRRERGSRKSYRVALLLGTLLVATTGFFGGSLIYGLNHYSW